MDLMQEPMSCHSYTLNHIRTIIYAQSYTLTGMQAEMVKSLAEVRHVWPSTPAQAGLAEDPVEGEPQLLHQRQHQWPQESQVALQGRSGDFHEVLG